MYNETTITSVNRDLPQVPPEDEKPYVFLMFSVEAFQRKSHRFGKIAQHFLGDGPFGIAGMGLILERVDQMLPLRFPEATGGKFADSPYRRLYRSFLAEFLVTGTTLDGVNEESVQTYDQLFEEIASYLEGNPLRGLFFSQVLDLMEEILSSFLVSEGIPHNSLAEFFDTLRFFTHPANLHMETLMKLRSMD